ncbi:MAG: glycosyltransferase [Desulfitobacterium sp.]
MAKTLMDSLKEHQINWDRYVILVDDYDKTEAQMLEDSNSYNLIKAIDIDLPNSKQMFFRYNILELNTAVKPWAFDMLFYSKEYDKVVYMDPDICVFDRLIELEDLLLTQGAIILTPHILRPIYDDKKPSELDLMRAGIYNLGFIAVSKGDQTRSFLNWWENKLEFGCVVDLPSGLFVDQKWMDFVPAIFEKVTILKHHGYNVAYWNMMQRTVSKSGGKYYVDGQPLVFYHFSGLDPTNIGNFSKHQNRFSINDIGMAKDIVKQYAERVLNNGFKETRKLLYAYDYFNDGIKINQFVRNVYNNKPYLIEKCGSDPFEKSDVFTSDYAFSGDKGEILITPVMSEIWNVRQDLQRAFPDYRHSQRYYFAKWYVESSILEYKLDEQYVKPVADRLKEYEALHQNNISDQFAARNIKRNKFYNACKPIIIKLARHSKPFVKSMCKETTWELLKGKYFQFISDTIQTSPIRAESQEKCKEALPSHSNSKGINLVAYIRGDFGVGEAGRATANSIKQSQIPFGIINFDQDIPHNANNRDWDNYLTKEFRHNVNVFNVNADQTPALEGAFSNDIWDGRYNIGYWVWELSEFPEEWENYFARFNEIWAPSRFVVESLSPKSPVPVVRIPYSIDVKVDKGLDRRYFGLPDEKFLFLFMFDVLSIQSRKNPEAVIKAFEAAFNIDDPSVGLVIKINNGKQTPEAVKRLRQQFEDRKNIYFIDRTMPKVEVNSLLQCVDSFVSLHRSEGFGLGLAEAMYLGKPVIGTNWSANTDFMNNKNSCPVDYKLIPLGQDYGPYKAHQYWADPDIEHAAEYMRRLVYDKDYYAKIAKQGERTIREEFSVEAVSKMIRSRLCALGLL